ncbi:three-helix bundle dimerization domain-containing protein [Mycobacteroides salmoniphilum]|uniref:Uncharacterized protein n=1 Tax=Mycobacteroides salmoniphilum TaxID=404941 RepID=A0A4R8SDF7_9MYCO|nr:hypothetical protein [Mycobacteroides salmoniphilum]TDZ93463.1 hypothetical protein CCUG60885_03066 [Mycobacteroides salmoniphilum]TEA09246.1 hypothetical protein CCUG60883_00007 [Mycobacteroides salmoniphilum]
MRETAERFVDGYVFPSPSHTTCVLEWALARSTYLHRRRQKPVALMRTGVIRFAVSGMSEQALLAAVRQRLTAQYAQVPPERAATIVGRVHALFAESPAREFVPLLVERRARAELAKAV